MFNKKIIKNNLHTFLESFFLDDILQMVKPLFYQLLRLSLNPIIMYEALMHVLACYKFTTELPHANSFDPDETPSNRAYHLNLDVY